MKHHFVVSLVKNGLIGGSLIADTDAVTYHTGKRTIRQEYRNLAMQYSEISAVKKDSLLFLPTVTFILRNGSEYKFVVFFGRTRLMDILTQKGVQA